MQICMYKYVHEAKHTPRKIDPKQCELRLMSMLHFKVYSYIHICLYILFRKYVYIVSGQQA